MKAIQKLFPLCLLSVTIISCKDYNTSSNYLQKVLSNLEKIESAVYFTSNESWQPGDTIPLFVGQRFYKEYNNPTDSTIGAGFIWLNANNTTQLEGCYDGNTRVMVNHDEKEIIIDDFSLNLLSFRPIHPPFFNCTKNIIKYALETNDSITLASKDLGDSYYFKLVINEDLQVEFFGKAHYMPDNPYRTGENTSIYELWISKSDDLPYKIRREMWHQTTVTTCSDVKINTLSIEDFQADEYFPPDYTIRLYGQSSAAPKSDLSGKIAPDWTLNDFNGQNVSLADLKSKVLLINFTGIGCGPCLAAVPFLRELKDNYNYNAEDFDIVAIECWKRPLHSLQSYATKNNLNYQFLSATDDMITEYQMMNRSVPVFLVLDKQRVVRKIIKGYTEKTTDEEITNSINENL